MRKSFFVFWILLFSVTLFSEVASSDTLNIPLKSIKKQSAQFLPDPKKIALERIKSLRILDSSKDTGLSEYPTIKLTLSEALDRLIIGNSGVIKAKLQWQAAQKNYQSTFGNFEPYGTFSYEGSSSDRYNAAISEIRESVKTGLEGILPTSTKYQLAFTQKDVKYAESSLDVPSVSTVFSLSQPLAKGFIGNSPRTAVRLAKKDREISYNRYRSMLMKSCYELENLYWRLVYIQERVKNSKTSVTVAQKIVDDSRTLVSSGIVSKLESVEAASQLAQRQTALSSVRLERAQTMNELLQMIGYTSDSTLLMMSATTPLDDSGFIEDSLINNDTVINKLIDNAQPEYLLQELNKERGKIIVTQHIGNVLPEIYLNGAFGVSGTSKLLGTAWERYRDPELRDFFWSFGAEVKIPLGSSIKERNLLAVERLNREIARLEEVNLRGELKSQVKLVQNKIFDLKETLKNIAVVVDYRRTLLKSEIFRLKTGLSNIRKVFELEKELAGAREQQLEIMVNYRIALALQDRLLGYSLARWGLETWDDERMILTEKLVQ